MSAVRTVARCLESPVKVRIGVGMGAARPADAADFGRLVDDLDELGFDSIWLPEVLTAPDPRSPGRVWPSPPPTTPG